MALWLGHASQKTTEVYLQADPMQRLEVADAVLPPTLRPGTFSPPDRLIELLKATAATTACGGRKRVRGGL